MTAAAFENPQPVSMSLLLLCAPCIVLGSWVLSRRSIRDEATAVALVPGIACALWMLGVHIASSCTRSFTLGLPLGTVAAAGTAGLALLGRDAQPLLPPRTAWPSRACGIATLLATALLVPAALGWSFHDEIFYAGHMATASQIENGHYPPRHGTFGSLPLRYHYGFNLLTAMLSSTLRLRVDRAIDLATIAGWAYAWVLCWVLGERLAGPRRGVWMAIVTLLGGGLAVFCVGVPVPGRLLSLVEINRIVVNPPLVSFFFQHPFSLGVPLGLSVLGLYLERRTDGGWWAASALLALLLALSLSQIVGFATFLASLLGAEVLAGRGRFRTRVVVTAGFGVIVILLARLLGGFLTPQPHDGGSGIAFSTAGPTGQVWANVLWNITTFGLLLPLGIAGVWLLWRRRRDAALLLALLVAGSWITLSFLKYERSWDISKFGTIAGLGLGLAAGPAIGRIVDLAPRRWGTAVAIVLSSVIATAGVGFLAVFALRLDGVPDFYWRRPDYVSPAHHETIAWLRRHARAGEVVFTDVTVARAYAQWGGLPEAQTDNVTAAYGFPRDMLVRRQALLRDLPANTDHYLHEGIRWIVVGPQDVAVHRLLESWDKQGLVRFTLRSEDVLVFQLLERPVASRPSGDAP